MTAIANGSSAKELAFNGEIFAKKIIGRTLTFTTDINLWDTPRAGKGATVSAPALDSPGTYKVDGVYYENGILHSVHLKNEDGSYRNTGWVATSISAFNN